MNAIPILLTELDNNDKITIKVGETLAIKLVNHPGTGYGYGWYTKSFPAELKENPEHVYDEHGFEKIYVTGVSSGIVDLTIEYKRPWQKDKVPLQTFNVYITVVGE